MALIDVAAKVKVQDFVNRSREPIHIPDYQRNYSWTEEEVREFWEDVTGFAARYPNEQLRGREYFLGSILGVESESDQRVLLLDGQQRVATIVILLASIRDAFAKLFDDAGKTHAHETQRDFIAHAEYQEPVSYTLYMNDEDRLFFRAAIQDFPAQPATPKGSSNKAISLAKRTFDSRIAIELDKLTTLDEQIRWLTHLRGVIARHLVFVYVRSRDEDDATEVFETLNDRGKDLSTLDLLRNFLLSKAGSSEARQEIAQYWSDVFRVSENPARVQSFLRHFWVIRYGDVKARGLYREIKQRLLLEFGQGGAANNPRAFSRRLSESAASYSRLIDAETESDALDAALKEIKVLDATATLPVLLAAYEKYGAGPTAPLANVLVSFFVRWSVIGRLESTVLERILYDAAGAIYKNGTLDEAMNRLRDEAPGDDEFREAFSGASVAKAGHQRHILTRLEAVHAERVQSELTIGKPSQVHVEHVYPRSPDPMFRLEGHDDWVNRIGNLTLLHGRKNASVGNRRFDQKVPAYASSSLQITKRLPEYPFWDDESEPGRWSSDGILQRQRDLAALAPEAWRL